MKKNIDEIYLEYKKNKKEIVENDLPLKGIKKAKMIYPFTKLLLKLLTIISGEKVVWLKKDNNVVQANRTVINVNTHRFKPDFEKITIKTKRPSFVVASDFMNAYGTISGWYFSTRPTVFVDPYSKEDKRISYEMMIKYLNAGLDCTIFPEAVWNLSENKPVLETFYGSIKAALVTDSVLVCTAIERYGKKYILNRSLIDFHTKASDKMILEEYNTVMRDTMATLLWEIWEWDAKENGITKRSSLQDNYWEMFVEKLTGEWPGYRLQDNFEQRYHSKYELELLEIRNDLMKITPKMSNAFLFNKRLKGKML